MSEGTRPQASEEHKVFQVFNETHDVLNAIGEQVGSVCIPNPDTKEGEGEARCQVVEGAVGVLRKARRILEEINY
jgi:hypothetical protein